MAGRSRVSEPKQQDKPFQISKWMVWEAFERVKANKGAAGVDEQSIEQFETGRDRNLYKIWLCRVGDYAERAVLGADTSSSGVRTPVRGSA
jgi:retron-type reverse transcriptase